MNIQRFFDSVDLDAVLKKEGFTYRGDRYIKITEGTACIVYKASRNVVASSVFEELISKWRKEKLLELK